MGEVVVNLPLPFSTRAEAKRMGVSHSTVWRHHGPGEDAKRVIGRDGKIYPARRMPQAKRDERDKFIRMRTNSACQRGRSRRVWGVVRPRCTAWLTRNRAAVSTATSSWLMW